MSVILFELLPLILGSVERLIPHTPPGPTGTRDVLDVVHRHLETGRPGKYMLRAPAVPSLSFERFFTQQCFGIHSGEYLAHLPVARYLDQTRELAVTRYKQ